MVTGFSIPVQPHNESRRSTLSDGSSSLFCFGARQHSPIAYVVGRAHFQDAARYHTGLFAMAHRRDMRAVSCSAHNLLQCPTGVMSPVHDVTSSVTVMNTTPCGEIHHILLPLTPVKVTLYFFEQSMFVSFPHHEQITNSKYLLNMPGYGNAPYGAGAAYMGMMGQRTPMRESRGPSGFGAASYGMYGGGYGGGEQNR